MEYLQSAKPQYQTVGTCRLIRVQILLLLHPRLPQLIPLSRYVHLSQDRRCLIRPQGLFGHQDLASYGFGWLLLLFSSLEGVGSRFLLDLLL